MPDNLVFTQANPFDHNENFLDFFKDESIKLYIDKDILNLTTHYKISENENIPSQSFVRYNNSYNVGNLKSVKYFISSSNYQVIGHSAFNDNGVPNFLNPLKKHYTQDGNITKSSLYSTEPFHVSTKLILLSLCSNKLLINQIDISPL